MITTWIQNTNRWSDDKFPTTQEFRYNIVSLRNRVFPTDMTVDSESCHTNQSQIPSLVHDPASVPHTNHLYQHHPNRRPQGNLTHMTNIFNGLHIHNIKEQHRNMVKVQFLWYNTTFTTKRSPNVNQNMTIFIKNPMNPTLSNVSQKRTVYSCSYFLLFLRSTLPGFYHLYSWKLTWPVALACSTASWKFEGNHCQ